MRLLTLVCDRCKCNILQKRVDSACDEEVEENYFPEEITEAARASGPHGCINCRMEADKIDQTMKNLREVVYSHFMNNGSGSVTFKKDE